MATPPLKTYKADFKTFSLRNILLTRKRIIYYDSLVNYPFLI